MYNKFIVCLFLLVSANNLFSQGNSININTPSFYEHAPALSADGKTMVFQSNRDGGYKLFESKLQQDGKWSDPKVINETHGIGKSFVLIGGPSLTYDGNTLFFCALLDGGAGDMDIYTSQKNGQQWSAPTSVGNTINTDSYEGFPSISADGKKLFFTRASGDATCSKILVSEKSEAGWQEPKELPSDINDGCAKSPRILSDGKTLIFSSKRNRGKGGFDLYRSVLSKDGKWGDAQALDFANSAESEAFGAITEMDEIMYFITKGDIYSIGVPPEIILNKVALTIIDEDSKKSIKAFITMKDTSAATQTALRVDSTNVDGKYQIVLLPGKKFRFEISAPGYRTQALTAGFLPEEEFTRLDKTIALKPKKREVRLKISDSQTGSGLTVDIKITNLETNEETIVQATLGRDGKYAVNLREGNTYNVEVSSKEGYAYSTMKINVPVSKTKTSTEVVADTALSSDGITSFVEPDMEAISHEIKVMPLKQGTKLLLKDIFFEFNAHELKDSSFVELSRLVDLLNENPKIQIEVNAHTDDVGSAEFNQKLSERRAQTIVTYLVSKGIAADRLKPVGFGKSKPVASNTTEEGRAKNRRVEMKIIDIN